MTEAVPVFATPSPRVRLVSVDRPWHWLALGWRDMTAAPSVSLAYGALIVALSFAIVLGLYFSGFFYLVLPAAAGFFLVAPVIGVGLYETSRRLAHNEPVSLAVALGAWRGNGEQIAFLGLILMLINLVWVRVATLLFALFYNQSNVTLDRLIEVLILSPIALPFLITGTLIGLAFATATFAIGAVSIPMLLERRITIFTAIATSMTVVRANWKPMALWAVLIVGFTAFGLATLFIGLALTMPLIGHASWHAYKDMVE